MNNFTNRLSCLIKEYFAVLIIFLCYLYSFLPLPFVQFSDGYWLSLPRFGYAVKEIFTGHFPVLNSFQFCGNNFLADVSTNILNPTFIFYLFLKPVWAYTVSVLLLFFILLIGTWKYFRERGFSYAASIVGLLGYAYSGQILFWSLYHGMNLSFTLFPCILFALRRFENTKLKKWRFLAFIFSFLTMLGGFIQFSILVLAVAIIEGMKDFSLKNIKETIKNRAITIILGGLSAFIVIIPTLEAILYSYRKYVPYSSIITPKLGILTLIMPFWGNSGGLHNYCDYFYYIGLVLIILAFYGLRVNFKELIIQPFFIFSLIFPLIILVVYLNILPENFQLGIASDPFRGIFVFIFMLSILAAIGTDKLINLFKVNDKLFKLPKEFIYCFLICLFFIFLLIPVYERFLNLIFQMSIIVLFLLIGFILIPVLKKKKTNFNITIFSFWIILLVFVNCIFQANNYLSTNVIHNLTNVIEIRKKQGMPVSLLPNEGRIVDASPFTNYFDDWAQCYKIRSMGGYATLMPASIFLRMKNDDLFPKEYSAFSHFKNNTNTNPDILAKYGVKYLIADNNIVNFTFNGNLKYVAPMILNSSVNNSNKKLLKEGWQIVFKSADGYLFKNPKYVGRSYVTDKNGNILKGAKISIDKDNYIKIHINGKKGQTLILADTWIPGWKCYDNGKKVKGFDANGFKGYNLNYSGDHEIEWVYQPKSFFYGGIISIFSIFAFILLSFYNKKIK
ncbi:MAG TPA: hypothetical protein DDW90_02305 [Cyanobacteria bacterium UBA9971]|nr:hypothetical protein [Cyanobacteria bacterium UBA9971]